MNTEINKCLVGLVKISEVESGLNRDNAVINRVAGMGPGGKICGPHGSHLPSQDHVLVSFIKLICYITCIISTNAGMMRTE